MIGLLLLAGAWGATEAISPTESYLTRAVAAMERARADIPAMQPLADQAAARLAAGGRLWAAGQPSLVSEISGRAGGIMMLRALKDNAATGDVVLYAVEGDAAVPHTVLESKALVIAFGGCPAGAAFRCLSNHASETGLSPTLANAIPAWIFTGELIAALTRLGKMPVVFETVGAYDGHARMLRYKNGEIAFHDDMKVEPVAAGILGNRFVDAVCAMLRRIEREEGDRLDRAGTWGQAARREGKQLYMYSMGHLFPDEVSKTEIGRVFHSDVWNAGFRVPHPNDAYQPGDFVVQIGYQQPADVLLRLARPAGARVAYVAVRPDRDFSKDDGVVWIDPMWDWPDACVSLEGYDIPILPASGIVNGAIAWELYRLTVR